MASDSVTTERALLEEHLLKQLPTYSAVAPGELELTTVRRRPASRLYRYAVHGTPPSRLVVKVPLARLPPPEARPRPRLMEPTPSSLKASLEFRALRAAQAHFAALGDPRFGWVEALDLVQPLEALVMLEADGTPLRRVMRDALFDRGARRSRAVAGLHAAGAWLRAYHGMAAASGTGERLADADAVADLFLRLADHLSAGRLGARAALVARRGADVARDALAGEVPLAVVHGDFALRNLLVTGAGRITVLDMLGRWRAPAYEDVATLLLGLDGMGLAPRLGGLLPLPGIVPEARAAFLAGYLGTDADDAQRRVGVFEALLALDRWAALQERGAASALTGRGLISIAHRGLAAR